MKCSKSSLVSLPGFGFGVILIETLMGIWDMVLIVGKLGCRLVALQIEFEISRFHQCKPTPNKPKPRICIWLVLSCAEKDFFALLAIVCTGWVPVNAGTHKRSAANPWGDERYSYVADVSSMCARNLSSNINAQKG